MKLTKKQALEKIEELKKYIAEKDKEEPKGYVIKNRYNNSEIFVSTKNNVRDAVIEAVEQAVNLKEANLEGANLREADLRGAELFNAKFYGKGGASKLKRNQVETFLKALGFIVED